jgi:uncharacterized protein (UPF0210 family)
MKIRTITAGFSINSDIDEKEFRSLAHRIHAAKEFFNSGGYDVQTLRTTTQPWDKYAETKNKIIEIAKHLDDLTKRFNLGYFNIGTTREARHIPFLYDVIKKTVNGFSSALISDGNNIDYEAALASAQLIKRLSKIHLDGFANLHFAALCNVKPKTPFFPASYNDQEEGFSIGTENSDLIYKACAQAKTIKNTKPVLKQVLNKEFITIQNKSQLIEEQERLSFDGIDVSISTSVSPKESIAYAFEQLDIGKFGDAGTLTIAKMITEVLQQIPVKKVGFCGLMLPVLEDFGLAQRNSEGCFDITSLLMISAVCGTGLDTIPLPGDVSEKALYHLLVDIASLSQKLKKPLSARLMPIPFKSAGDMTEFSFDYFVNSKIMNI